MIWNSVVYNLKVEVDSGDNSIVYSKYAILKDALSHTLSI